jgi:hypothetical protein
LGEGEGGNRGGDGDCECSARHPKHGSSLAAGAVCVESIEIG